MGTTGSASNWERIRLGVKDAEQLIGKKEYNLSMVKCRQTLEFMVRLLADKACLVEGDLNVTIDALYQGKWISKTTCDHYHKIRMIGNKAVHEGSSSAYDANQAYHLLSQEVYTFSSEYKTRKHRPAPSTHAKARRTSRKGRASRSFSLSQTDIIRILAAVLCVALVVVVIQFLAPHKGGKEKETSPVVTTQMSLPETSTAPETMAQTTPAAVYKTSSDLNVRSQPSTSGSKLGQIPAGTVVDYVGSESDDWAIINYKGQKAYVASQYLVHD